MDFKYVSYHQICIFKPQFVDIKYVSYHQICIFKPQFMDIKYEFSKPSG